MENTRWQQHRQRSLTEIRRDIERRLRDRPSREELFKHGILRRQATLIQTSTPRDLGKSSGSTRPLAGKRTFQRAADDDSTISYACSGLGFSVAITSDGDMCAYGTPQSITYETLRGPQQTNKTRSSASLCHPSKAAECKLPNRDPVAMTTTSIATSFPIRSLLVSNHHRSIRQVACGVSHCIALVQSDMGDLQLFSWGLGPYGQLGLGEQIHLATCMVPVTTSAELASALLAARGNLQSIQLRCGALSSCLTITHAVSSSVWLWGLLPVPQDASGFVRQPTPASNFVSECPFRIQDVSLGLAHLALLCDQGHVFTWGHNTSSQLGRGLHHRRHHKQEDDPVGTQPIPVAFHQPELRFGSIACGYDHTLALSRDGSHVFAWGSNRVGACGAATKFFEYAHPVRVSLTSDSERILSISCKAHTSLAVVEKTSVGSRVMVWGVYGSQKAHLLPTRMNEQEQGYWSTTPWIVAGYGAIQWLVDVDDEDHCHLFTSPHQGEAATSTATTTESASADAERSTPLLTIIGLSVVVSSPSSTTASIPVQLGDLQWTRPMLHRIRIFTGDVVVLLLTTSSPLRGDCLSLRPRLGQSEGEFPVNATRLPWPSPPPPPPPSSGSSSSSSFLYSLVLPFESVAALDLEWLADGHRQNALESITLLSIDCCLHPCERDGVLRFHHVFLLSCLENAIQESTKEPNETTDDQVIVAGFLSLATQHYEIQHAVAYSPFARTIEQDQIYSMALDVDRSAMDRAWRLSRDRPTTVSGEIPTALVLWSSYLEPSSGACEGEEDDDAMEIATWCTGGMEGLSLWNLLCSSLTGDEEQPEERERLYLSMSKELLMTWEVSNGNNEPEKIEPKKQLFFADYVTTPSTVSLLSTVSMSVPQTAVDFLVNGSHSRRGMDRHSVVDDTQTFGIRLWWNDRGDQFYSYETTTTDASSAGVVQIHLPDDLPDDANHPTALCVLQRELHTFLWHVLDSTPSLSIRNFRHQFFGGSVYDAEQLHKRLQRRGFRSQAPPEVWFSLFAVLLLEQQHKRSGRGQLTLQAVRLFLVDPFHDAFFRGYVADWRDAVATQQPLSVEKLLSEVFPHKQPQISWTDFVAGLQRLHDAVEWQLDPQTVCRLLYRYDSKGDGHIDVCGILRILHLEISRPESSPQTKSHRRLGLGLRHGRPPNVDAFATRDAMRKLFQSRAKDGRLGKQQENTEMNTLLRMGNTRLAQIRNLPVSRLLSEGVHFRPRPAKYMHITSSGDDAA